jgi:outer membrane lipoprotein-sorting protein
MTCWHACLRFSACLLLWLSTTATVVHAQKAPAVDATQLLRAFSQMPGLEARFVEEKHISMLALPLESAGVLYFARPGLLLRRVEKPRSSEVLITPTRLQLVDAEGKKTIDLGTRPDLRPFVQSLVWILTGDEKALSRTYQITFVPSREGSPWTLTLVPRTEPLSHMIAHIRILGQGARVSEVEVQEKSGDRTVTRIVDANPARTFSKTERHKLFGDGAAE